MPHTALLRRLCSGYRAILGSRLTGFYVHGSVGFGCFSWATGDLDFIAIVNAPLTQAEKEALIRLLLALSPDAPPKGLEMSVVLRHNCSPFRYPTPFELHYSNAHKAHAEADVSAYCRDMHGDDPDLAAHFTVLHAAGLTLFGPPIPEVFAPVPRACYVDSIWLDVQSAEEDIISSPVYSTLNLCRVLAYLTDGSVLSKEQGGQWGLQHLPQTYQPLLEAALEGYHTGKSMPAELPLTAFAADLLCRIRPLLDDPS